MSDSQGKNRIYYETFLGKVRDSADGIVLKGKIYYDTKRLEFDEVVDQSGEDEEDDDTEDWE